MTAASNSPSSTPRPSAGGQEEAVIVIKAAPRLSTTYGETVCTAGITKDHRWVRLYPITFRKLDKDKQFSRWDKVSYTWQPPKNDPRAESRRLDYQSLSITGNLAAKDRYGWVSPMVKESLAEEYAQGRSLAFIRPTIKSFIVEKKPQDEFEKEREKYAEAAKQPDLFLGPVLPYTPCPYTFKYKYETKDGERTGTCQDWETEATFFNWRKLYTEEETIRRMKARWGEEMPTKGLLFAMGTHSLYPETWLINGLIQISEVGQLTLDL
jgi:hypothetical protein